MNTLHVYLKDCYGIGELQHDFDFSKYGQRNDIDQHKQTNIIYAHNGVMKTSFAKTFEDVSHERSPKDYVNGRTSVCRIDADGVDIPPSSIFVVHAIGEYFESEKMMTLLADQATQERYVEIMNDINAAITALFDDIGEKIGERGVAKSMQRFDNQMKTNDSLRLKVLVNMKRATEAADLNLLRVNYRAIDDSKVVAFLDKPATHVMLKDYVETYDALMTQSKYFSDGLYDYTNATNVQKSIEKNNFMKAKNRVVLVDKDANETPISTLKEFERLYLEDKNRVFSNLELKTKYERFDKEIEANEQLREFQKWIKQNQDFIPRLQNQKNLKTQTWYAYLAESGQLYTQVVAKYENYKDELSQLYDTSEKLVSRWQSVVEKFNQNFDVPFEVKIKNKKDVILDRSKPELEFIFTDERGGIPKAIEINILNNSILSKGESRALFILCIMFEIESRILAGGDHVVIFDDIADSFDYKNKYAIIEYLHGISRDFNNGIHMIIMTHNFDFFRSFRMRCQSWHESATKASIATRERGGVVIFNSGGSVDEFARFRKDANTEIKIFLALVPFARNLSEYAKGTVNNQDYLSLTSCLHQKLDTQSIVCGDVANIIGQTVDGLDLSIYATNDKYVDILKREVADVILNSDESKLEHKILLSMAIRLAAEQYMSNRFVADGELLSETSNQTGKWYGKFIDRYGASDIAANVLNKVMIVTPESLHINSFMYEPIMDMSLDELKKLYEKILKL